MTLVVHKPFSPVEKMREALRIWGLTAQILHGIRTRSLMLNYLPTSFKLEPIGLPFEVRLTPREYGRVARNSFYASTGLCALVFDDAMDVTFGSKPRGFPTQHTGLAAGRAIVCQVRNAFAHGLGQPKWKNTDPNCRTEIGP